jgi:hypothetical protein
MSKSTVTRIDNEQLRQVDIIANLLHLSRRETINLLIEEKFKSLIEEPVNAETSV